MNVIYTNTRVSHFGIPIQGQEKKFTNLQSFIGNISIGYVMSFNSAPIEAKCWDSLGKFFIMPTSDFDMVFPKNVDISVVPLNELGNYVESTAWNLAYSFYSDNSKRVHFVRNSRENIVQRYRFLVNEHMFELIIGNKHREIPTAVPYCDIILTIKDIFRNVSVFTQEYNDVQVVPVYQYITNASIRVSSHHIIQLIVSGGGHSLEEQNTNLDSLIASFTLNPNEQRAFKVDVYVGDQIVKQFVFC